MVTRKKGGADALKAKNYPRDLNPKGLIQGSHGYSNLRSIFASDEANIGQKIDPKKIAVLVRLYNVGEKIDPLLDK